MQKTEKYSSINKNSSHNVECEKENETILNFITFFSAKCDWSFYTAETFCMILSHKQYFLQLFLKFYEQANSNSIFVLYKEFFVF